MQVPCAILFLCAFVVAAPEPDRVVQKIVSSSSTSTPASTPTIRFTTFYTKGDDNCSGKNITETYKLSKCHNLPFPAHSWYSYGPGEAGGFPDGLMYSGSDCKGEHFTEHFDADGACFVPLWNDNYKGKVIRSFYVAPA